MRGGRIAKNVSLGEKQKEKESSEGCSVILGTQEGPIHLVLPPRVFCSRKALQLAVSRHTYVFAVSFRVEL